MPEAGVLRTGGHVAENLARIREAIAEAAARAGRRAEDITLVAVSKTQPAEAVVEAIEAGLRDFGENRVQEATEKRPTVERLLANSFLATGQNGTRRADDDRAAGAASQGGAPSGGSDGRETGGGLARPGLRWHMIGHLQTNKAALAAGLFDSIDSVDSLRLAAALSRRVVAAGGPELGVRLEVYVGDDPARPGLRPTELVGVASQIVELPGLRVEGLMTVAPLGGDARAAFSQVRELKERLAKNVSSVHFGVLSMGMSDDFPLAIQEGSTEIRIGTALFGSRQPR